MPSMSDTSSGTWSVVVLFGAICDGQPVRLGGLEQVAMGSISDAHELLRLNTDFREYGYTSLCLNATFYYDRNYGAPHESAFREKTTTY